MEEQVRRALQGTQPSRHAQRPSSSTAAPFLGDAFHGPVPPEQTPCDTPRDGLSICIELDESNKHAWVLGQNRRRIGRRDEDGRPLAR
jgi:hypothetical protein